MTEKDRVISYIKREIDEKLTELHSLQVHIDITEKRLDDSRTRVANLLKQIEELESLKVTGGSDDN